MDNILLRIHDEGIPDGRGGFLHPSMLRIAKYNYICPFARLHKYTVNEASRLYDHDNRNRATPTIQAKRRRADECIIFFTTCSSAGGCAFRQLHEKPDIIIHDEAANSAEPEALVPITTTTYTGAEGSLRRCYYIGVGDDKQLHALEHVSQMLKSSKMIKYWKVNPAHLTVSLFERMIYYGRVTFSFLSAQYRMHPAISRITSVPFYRLYFKNPLPIGSFLVEYNQVTVENPFSWSNFCPMTFIDTSNILAKARYEVIREHGNIVNNVEAQVVSDCVKGLYLRFGHKSFDGRIAVIAPYREQVENIQSDLMLNVAELATVALRTQRDVKVCTVDSMQGSQRDIVIFSVTRSNQLGTVGFVRDARRLNVSLTIYLTIVISDYSTITTVGRHEGYGLESLTYIYNKCLLRAENNGSCVAQIALNRSKQTQTDHFYLISPKLASNIDHTRAAASSKATCQYPEPDLVNDTPTFNYSTLYPYDNMSNNLEKKSTL